MNMMTTFPAVRTHARRVALVVAGCVVLAACSSGTDDSAAPDPNDLRDSPLAQLLGYDLDMAEQRAFDLEMQQVIAQCMRDEGWEYEPVDYHSAAIGDESEWELQMSDPEAYGEKYGYGIVRSYETQGGFDAAPAYEDPNSDYVNSLSPSEMDAYYDTLYGGQAGVGDDGEVVTPPLAEQGCQGKAVLATFGENSPATNQAVQERISDFYATSADDPAYVRAVEVWSECMRDKDPTYDFESPDVVQSDLWDRLSELQGYGVEPVDGDGTFDDPMSAPEPATISEADLEDLRQDELRRWRADWDCQQEAALAQVRLDAEQRLVDELLAEFPDLAVNP